MEGSWRKEMYELITFKKKFLYLHNNYYSYQTMINLYSEIQRLNADSRLSHLHSMYESNSFLNCLSVSRREMSHSMFLSELFKEDSFHDVGTLPLQFFLEAVLERAVKQDTRLKEHPEKTVIFPSLKSAILARNLSLSDIDVSTEVNFSDGKDKNGRVDILISCRVKPLEREDGKDVKFLNIIIENKIYAGEKDKQTEKYYQHFNAFLKNKAEEQVDISIRKGGPRSLYNLYVYLTPATPSEIDALKEPECKCKEFIQICYQDILDRVLDPLLEQKGLSPRGRFFIEEYKRSLGVSFDNVEIYTLEGGNNQKLKVNTTIMAIGQKESEEICKFWSDYKDLFETAINEKNRQDDDDCGDDSTNNAAKRTVYEYHGQPFSMSRLVEAIILDHLPEYSTSEINQLFKSIVSCGIISKDAKLSYFERIEEVRTRDLDTICVFRQWTEQGPYKFLDFCEKVKELGWYEMTEYKKPRLSPEDSLMLVEFYTKNEKLLTTAMEIVCRANKGNISSDVEALMKRTKSHRDRSTYSITLHADNSTKRGLSWGRLVLTMLQDYVSEVPSTIDELKNHFNLPNNSLKKLDPNKLASSGYFNRDLDILHLADGTKCFVKIGWNSRDLKKVIEAAKKQLYQIEKDVK